jgi:hypothetical protein
MTQKDEILKLILFWKNNISFSSCKFLLEKIEIILVLHWVSKPAAHNL